MRRGQAHHATVDRFIRGLDPVGEVLADHRLVRLGRDDAGAEKLARLRRAHEQIRAKGVIERTHRHDVARAEQHVAARVPDGQREIAEQAERALGAPALVGVERQLGVGAAPEHGAGRLECGPEFGAIVEAAVERDPQTGRVVPVRLAIDGVLGRRPQQLMRESRRAVEDVRRAVRSAMRRGRHQRAQQVAVRRTAVAVQDGGDAAHAATSAGASPSRAISS